jgi:protocatechuate 3,4-dioxygenase beta subunit
MAESCGLTPTQMEGPFYPGENEFRAENDLTQVPGRPRPAKGQVVRIQGIVQDESCRPIENANVEIWQACASGKYHHANDPNPAPLDPDFKYWGEAFTDSRGSYEFRTIIPGAYPAGDGWVRPPHIHYKVSRLGYHELTTQMYFAGDPLNQKDRILLSLPPEERARVIVPFLPSGEPRVLVGSFKITMRRVGN